MFRNPRDNVSRHSSEKLKPSTGRPPSPPAAGSPPAVTTTGMAVELAKTTQLPRLGTPSKVKITPPKNGKPKPKGNSSILSFFKKAELGQENQENEIDGLFVQDRKGLDVKISSNTFETAARNGIGESEVVLDTWDDNRFNESPNSVKRRKTSHSPAPTEKVPPAKQPVETLDKEGCNPPPADFDDEKNPAVLEGTAKGSSVKFERKAGPFLEDSDSEAEEDEGQRSALQETNTADLQALPEHSKNDRQDAENIPTAEEDETLAPNVPNLKRESTTFAEADGFADFEGLEDFEDEYEEGEEFVERRYMREQRRIAVESGLDVDSDAEFDAEELTETEVRNDVETEQVQGGAVKSEEIVPSNDSSASSCPMCSVNLKGISDQDASVHVNNCLDGNPTPLPEADNAVTPLIKQEEQPTNAAKRFVRPPKPSQQNPFTLGQPSGSSSAFSKLMSGHSEETAWSAAAACERDSRGKPSYQRTCPFYKILPGFFTAVDAFRYGAVAGCNAYFLSHFHSDHYIGLTSTWSHGKIYCSRITANLVRQQLRVDPKWVVDLEWEQKIEIPHTQGVHVTMIPANHCPGSSLYLFEKVIEPPKTAPSNAKPRTQRVLHCGDFRACPAHIAHPHLAPEVVDNVTGKLKHQKIDVCYLDTTYLNPKWAFPSQEDVITACADMCVSLSKQKVDETDSYETMKRERAGKAMAKFVRKDSKDDDNDALPRDPPTPPPTDPKHKKSRGALLVVVGTYSIGKERICLGIARALDSLIYAPASKQRICAALNDRELNRRLTSDPLAASVHMTPLFEIRAETLSEYLESYRGHFSRAVGFRPSGWNYRPPGSRSTEAPTVQQVLYSPGWKSTYSMKDLMPQRGSSQKSQVFGVPYSEHSSFRELSMFVCGLRIEKIIPTVNVGSAKSRERMRAWCERWAAEKRKNGLFRVKKPPDQGGVVKMEKDDERSGDFYPGQGTWELETTL